MKVAVIGEVPPGTSRCVEADGKEIALHNVEGKIYACANICPHQGGPLAEGILEGANIICPWHAWAFDLVTGTSPVNPRTKIDIYEVKVDKDDIYINVLERK